MQDIRGDTEQKIPTMGDVTLILSQIEDGDDAAAAKLLPLAYDELRKLSPLDYVPVANASQRELEFSVFLVAVV